MMQVIETVEVNVSRELTDYEMRRLGETLDLLGFEICLLNNQELKVTEMCKVDKSWEHVWDKFDAEQESGLRIAEDSPGE